MRSSETSAMDEDPKRVPNPPSHVGVKLGIVRIRGSLKNSRMVWDMPSKKR